MPTLIAAKAELHLLKEEAGLEVLDDFQNDCIKAGSQYFPLENYQLEKQEDKFICNLNVSCPCIHSKDANLLN